jgi:hypothetical protein
LPLPRAVPSLARRSLGEGGRLLFCEYHAAKSDALKRESYFKTSAGKRTLGLMCHDALAEFRVNNAPAR